jgi:hypothetical protein
MGAGRFLIAGRSIYWATSDNTDPRGNFRSYVLRPKPRSTVGPLPPDSALPLDGHLAEANDLQRAHPHFVIGQGREPRVDLKARALFDLIEFSPQSGHCFTVKLPTSPVGDSEREPRRSAAQVLEDGVPLGPAHAAHAEIRQKGEGRYSTSDNSDPNTNGRRYALWLPPTAVGPPDHSVALAEAIRTAAAAPESEIHALLCARLLTLGTSADPSLRLGHVLEIGSYSHPGLAFLLLLMGAERVTLNNQKPITNHLSAAYVENLVALTVQNPSVRKDWPSFLTADGDGYRVRSEYLGITTDTDAGQIGIAKSSVDFALSLSVLEHIRHLPTVLDHLRTLIRPGGAMWHWVDVRDHTSFADPLKYLRLSKEEFEATYLPENNRWRPSDYLRMLEEADFSTVDAGFCSQNPLESAGTDIMWFIREDLAQHLPASIEQVRPWVTDEMKSRLHPDFGSFSRSELSITGFYALSKRRQSLS